jgi:hypothetical protein
VATRQIAQSCRNLFADASPLKARPNRNVANIGTIDATGESASRTGEDAFLECKAFVHAVREGALQVLRLLVAEGCDPIELG